jgi:ribonuclease J
LAEKYKCPIIVTPYTEGVLSNIIKNERIHFKSKVIRMNAGMEFKISKNLKIEFIYATHSTPQTVIIAVHTPEGPVVYANDWKFDEYPTLGKRTDYARLSELGKCGVLALISDSTRIDEERRTFSESLVKEMFKDILFWTENQDSAIFVATFASHVARINMLVGMAKEMGRKPVLLGRSMLNYVSAAERIGLVNVSKNAKILGYKQQIAKTLREIQKNRKKYFVICTGCQGEPNSVLTKIARDQFKFEFSPEDQVIFSSNVIPSEINKAHRAELERILKQKKVRIFTDVHVSGHGSKEDARDMLKILKPKHYVPSHGDLKKLAVGVELGKEMGYVLGKTVHLMQNGYRWVVEE